MTSAPDLRSTAEQHLRALVGSPDAVLRDDQWRAVEALVVEGRRALVVQRTGWGKSAVYFVATALLRAAGKGPTVIVSPLLSLMRNQVEAARKAGITAVTMNSSNTDEWVEVQRQVEAGEVDVLLVSPERLTNPDFRRDVLPALAATCGLLVVDEAHCISDWGHDFRPDYRRIASLLEDLPPGTPVLATTATANGRVTRDVADQLRRRAAMSPQLAGSAEHDVLVLRGPLARSSLQLGVLRLPDQPSRLAWLADHLGSLDGSGIIYCLTVAGAEQVASFLRSRGFAVAAYSGRTDPAERLTAEDDLINNRVKALVATSALGMGFDKPDLGFVVHLGSPSSPVAYYQQVGRAGRGLPKASAVLLPSGEDQAVWSWFADQAMPAEKSVNQVLDALEEAGTTLSTAALENQVDLRRGRLEMLLKVLDVDGAVDRVKGGWRSTGRTWAYDTERYERVAQARTDEAAAMIAYQRLETCRMQFLAEQLDDPSAAPCGRCDVCTGVLVASEVSEGSVAAASERLQRPGVPVEPRGMWPTGLAELGVKGKVREQAQEGRAIGRLTDLGWGAALRAAVGPGSVDGELAVPLRHALVSVLDDWNPDVDGVVAVGSTRHPLLVAHLADGMSRYRKIPVLGHLEPRAGLRPSRDVNSATRLKQVWDAHRLDGDVAGRRVLLVDDLSGSGWTLAVNARRLLQAGAAAVYSLVLATEA